jgi:phage shock protein E
MEYKMLLTVPELVALAKKSVSCVSAAQAFTNKDATFIDVREPTEFNASSIDNSLHIPRGILEMTIAKHCPDADMEIYLHCASGGRAALAAEQLQRIGYTNVKAISCQHNDVCQAQKNQ